MENIRNQILNSLGNTKISFENIPYQELFNLYDELRFNHQIQNRLDENRTKLSFEGSIDGEIPPKRCCCVLYRLRHHKIEHIDMCFSDWMVARLETSTSSERLSIFGDSEMDICILKLFEHTLSHAIGILWNQYSSDDKIQGCHESLYDCSTSIFFDSSINRILLNLENTKSLNADNTIESPYMYWKNSCNIDSITMVLLGSKYRGFRDAIFTTNPMSLKSSHFTVSCRKNSNIASLEDWRQFVDRSVYALITDYRNMTIKGLENLKCINLRETLAECLTDMKKKKQWFFYNVAELYDLYTDMFPNLKIRIVPYLNTDNTTRRTIKTLKQDKNISSFTFWDFMHDISSEELSKDTLSYNNIDWDSMDTPFLVFKNEGIAIQKFGSISSEKIIVGEEEIVLTKNRVFGETILSGRYEMVGAVILEGTSPGEEGGVHYHSCINTRDGWVYYNDVNGKFKNLQKFPKIILTEVKGRKPEMYFYYKV